MTVGASALQQIAWNVTIPPGTTPDAPLVDPIDLGDVWMDSFTLLIPPGGAGSVGWNLTYAGGIIFPWAPPGIGGNQSPWFIANQYDDTIPIKAEIGGTMAFTGYNTGAYLHTIYLVFACIPIAAKQARTTTRVTPIDLS